ncbi:MAG: tetratricopeptide repeat protein [Dokdonella sp.]
MVGNRFLHELNRRHVFRVAAAYAVIGWALIQVTSTVVPALHLPDALTTAVVLLVLLGFPITLVLAWVFEMTPDGVRRTEPHTSTAARAPVDAQRIGRRLSAITIGALGLAVAVLLWRQFGSPRNEPDTAPASTTLAATTSLTMPARSAAGEAIPEKSIAVLPFENQSSDKDNAYFTDGIHDEILVRVANVSALKVISRTSTEQYATNPGNLGEVGRQLGVAHVLEGSVQKAGDKVRITVQLVRTMTGEQLWAETYDRKLDDVFQVESEVAQAVASAMQVELSGGEKVAVQTRPTTSTEAYDAYLRGLAAESSSLDSSADVPRRAAALYANATRIDPDFALAWARLSIIKSYMYLNFIDRTPAQASEVKNAADTALRLQPELGEAHLALGYYRYRCLHDFAGALLELEQALQRMPNNAYVLSSLAYVERRQDNWRGSIAHLQQAIRLDPREGALYAELAINYSALRDFPNARATLDRAIEIEPGSASLIASKAGTFLEQGDMDQAATLLDGVPLNPTDGDALRSRLKLLWYRRDFATAITVLQQALTTPKESLGLYRAYYLAALGASQAWANDGKSARASFTEAVAAIASLRQSGTDDVHLAQVLAFSFAGLDDKPAALREARHAVDLASQDALMRPSMEIPLAQIQAHLGDSDTAIAALPHLLEQPNGLTIGDLRLNPLWDPLRADPRFKTLLAAREGNQDSDPQH